MRSIFASRLCERPTGASPEDLIVMPQAKYSCRRPGSVCSLPNIGRWRQWAQSETYPDVVPLPGKGRAHNVRCRTDGPWQAALATSGPAQPNRVSRFHIPPSARMQIRLIAGGSDHVTCGAQVVSIQPKLKALRGANVCLRSALWAGDASSGRRNPRLKWERQRNALVHRISTRVSTGTSLRRQSSFPALARR